MSELGEMFWRTRDGTYLRFREMTTSHLRNVLAMVNRRVESYAEEADAAAGYGGNSEAAQDAAESAMDHAFNEMHKNVQLAETIQAYLRVREAEEAPVLALTERAMEWL